MTDKPEPTTDVAAKKNTDITQAEVLEKLNSARADALKLIVRGICAYGFGVAGGLVLGGIGAGVAAGYFGLGALAVTGATLLGIAVGGVAGFFGAKVFVMGMIEDFTFDHGLEVGKLGLRGLGNLLKKAKEAVPSIKKPLEAVEGLTTKTENLAKNPPGLLGRLFAVEAAKKVAKTVAGAVIKPKR